MADQEYRDSLFIKQDSRENFKNVIAKRSDLVQFAGGRIKPAPTSTPVTNYAGTVLGFATSGADSGYYKPYAVGNADGSQVAVGVLAEDCITDNFGNGSEISVIKNGCLFSDLLIGLDANAKTNLQGQIYTEHGTNLIDIRS